MARTTKAALEAQIKEQQAQIEQLQAALLQAQEALALAAQQIEQLEDIASMKRERTQRPVRSSYVQPAWQAERAAAMAAAREMAMRIGRSVRVG